MLPSHEPDRAGPKSVHQQTQRHGGGAQQEGADGEAQIQDLLLFDAARPAVVVNESFIGGSCQVLWMGSEVKPDKTTPVLFESADRFERRSHGFHL